VVSILIAGTGLAPLSESAGALERAVLSWAEHLRDGPIGADVALVAPDDPVTGGEHVREEALRWRADLVICNNRPLWTEGLEGPVLHVLHNYPDAWGVGAGDHERVRIELGRGAAAVSPTLGHHIAAAFELPDEVPALAIEVERVFALPPEPSEALVRDPGLVLFPQRLLEKKGVRLFLEIARQLELAGRPGSAASYRCVVFRHLAPFPEPTPEQRALLEAIAGEPAVELLDPPDSRTEMAAWYRQAGVVVCCSTRPEGLGMVALEAQAVGAPIVTSGLGGLADATFAPNETVLGTDASEWAAAVVRALERPPSDSPHREVEARYGPDAVRESVTRIVRAALTRSKP
jgi:glycosyltransferase involved in cell wall biosynthesis